MHTNLSYSHNHYGQSFLNSQDGWLGGITVFSMVPNYFQPLTLLIYRCDDQGVPDHQQCIAQLDLDVNSIQPCYQQPIHVGDILPPGSHMVGVANPDPNYPDRLRSLGYIVLFSKPRYYIIFVPTGSTCQCLPSAINVHSSVSWKPASATRSILAAQAMIISLLSLLTLAATPCITVTSGSMTAVIGSESWPVGQGHCALCCIIWSGDSMVRTHRLGSYVIR